MRNLLSSIFLLGGIALAVAALPVFAQTIEPARRSAANDFEIDKKPLRDFADAVKSKRVDWAQPFAVEVETTLTERGKFDAEKTKFTKSEGDAETAGLVRQGLQAIGDSGWLAYLRATGVENLRLSAAQTSDDFSFSADSEQITPERARTLASTFNMMVMAVQMLDRNGSKKLGDYGKKLLSGAKVTVQEKTVSIKMTLPANDFREMVRRGLNESKEATTK